MTMFYVNKYPLKGAVQVVSSTSSELQDLPEGTVFKVVSMDAYCLHLCPVNKKHTEVCIGVNPLLLEVGFTATEFID